MARIGLLEWFRNMTRPGNYGFGHAIGSRGGDIVDRFLPSLRTALWENPIGSAYPDMMILDYLERRDARLRALAAIPEWKRDPRKLSRYRFRLDTYGVTVIVTPVLLRNGFQVLIKGTRKPRAFIASDKAARWAHLNPRHLNGSRDETERAFRLARGAGVAALRAVFAADGDEESALALSPSAKLPPYAWPGGYLLGYYLGNEYDVHCADCAGLKDPKSIRAVDVNYEGPTDYCAECNREMPSEYGDPESADAEEESAA